MNKRIFSLLLVLVSATAGIYFRFYPKLLPYYDILASQEVHDAEWTSIQKSIQEKYPQLPVSSQLRITNEVFKERLKTGKPEIDNKIAARSQSLKSHFRDEKGHIYVDGIDSYYFLRFLKNFLKTGDIGVKVVNGVGYDDLVFSPVDPVTKKNVHLWLGLIFYKTAHFFNKDIPLEEAVFYLPLFLSVVLALFSFYVARELGANDLGAFFASIAINLSPFLLERGVGEWFRTDIYNVLFPLLVFGTFLFAFGEKRWSRRIFFITLSGILLSCYASTWKGWWFIFDIMLLSGFLYILNQKMSQRETEVSPGVFKDHVLFLLFFFAVSTIFIILLNGISVWKDFIAEPLRLSSILKLAPVNAWPNVYWTVAELAPLKPFQVANLLGGNFVFFGGMIGLLYICLFEKGLRDERIGFGLFCVVFWIIAIFYTAMTAMRFTLLLIPPVGLAFGLVISKLYTFIDELSRKYLNKYRAQWVRAGGVFVFSIYLVSTTMTAHNKALGSMPMMDDHWHHALMKIKNETPKEAIIDSWWDYGHWFKGVAERRVLFDGMTQNTPYAYWIASTLLTDDEEEAIGILRMINTADNKVADFLEQKEKWDAAKAVEIIKKVVRMDEKSAQDYLSKERLSVGAVHEVLKYLFPEKLPPVYFIISYDMLSKIGAISYVRNWDFKKVDMWYKKSHLSREDFLTYCMNKYGYTKEEAESSFLDISFLNGDGIKGWFSQGWSPPSVLSTAKQDGNVLFFDNGLVVDLNNYHAHLLSEFPERRGVPKSLLFWEDGRLKEELQKESDLDLAVLLMKEGDSYKSLLLNPSFAKSMMVRLYFLKGEGLKFFKLYHKEVDEKGNAIYIYQIQWPKEKM